MDHGCVVPDVASASGVFNQTAATVSGPWDRYQRVVACATDADCSAELGSAATWVCERPAEDACISNPNGSDNSRCRQLCDDDRDCEATVGLSGICQQFGISAASRGCVLPLPTEGCATATGPVLEGGELDQLACLAVMPHTQLSCFAHEQGMRAAWSALDPVGANAAQSAGLLREAAMLAVVFITDAEDCSLAPDAQELSADDALRCGQLADTAGGGPLWPTAALHDALVSLKADPAMVSVLTIAGDSLGADPTEVDSDRADYATSVADPLECHARSSICSTGTSVAQLGSRWLDLAARFGDRGLFHNVCTPAEIGASLRELVTRSGAGWLQTCGP